MAPDKASLELWNIIFMELIKEETVFLVAGWGMGVVVLVGDEGVEMTDGV